jgi:glycerol-3-phosphate O-acyltransferase
MELFVEGTRTRSGKLSHSKNPIFDILVKDCIVINEIYIYIQIEKLI